MPETARSETSRQARRGGRSSVSASRSGGTRSSRDMDPPSMPGPGHGIGRVRASPNGLEHVDSTSCLDGAFVESFGTSRSIHDSVGTSVSVPLAAAASSTAAVTTARARSQRVARTDVHTNTHAIAVIASVFNAVRKVREPTPKQTASGVPVRKNVASRGWTISGFVQKRNEATQRFKGNASSGRQAWCSSSRSRLEARGDQHGDDNAMAEPLPAAAETKPDRCRHSQRRSSRRRADRTTRHRRCPMPLQRRCHRRGCTGTGTPLKRFGPSPPFPDVSRTRSRGPYVDFDSWHSF